MSRPQAVSRAFAVRQYLPPSNKTRLDKRGRVEAPAMYVREQEKPLVAVVFENDDLSG